MLWVQSPYRLIALGLWLVAPTCFLKAGSIPRQDRAWKVYLNRATGFCVSYPSRWMKSETYEGAGIAVATGMKRRSPIPIGSMDVSALAIGDAQVRSAAFKLDDDLDLQLAGLRKFARAEQIEILDKRHVSIGAIPSLFVKIRYLDPRDRKIWIDEVIFAQRGTLSYRLELETRADQLTRFETNFTQFVNSFQPECGKRTGSTASASLSAVRLNR
jgi:hypothetical protein